MVRKNDPYAADLATIEKTLKAARAEFLQFRFGGLNQQYKESLEALAAFERLKAARESKQLELF